MSDDVLKSAFVVDFMILSDTDDENVGSEFRANLNTRSVECVCLVHDDVTAVFIPCEDGSYLDLDFK